MELAQGRTSRRSTPREYDKASKSDDASKLVGSTQREDAEKTRS
jgi:hypothetical protein